MILLTGKVRRSLFVKNNEYITEAQRKREEEEELEEMEQQDN